jgi:hypothetical protein
MNDESKSLPARLVEPEQAEYAAAAAAKKAAEEATDWRPLAEDVTMHTMAFVICGDRMCGHHARLGVWTFDGTKECLRDHPSIAEILACAPGDAELTEWDWSPGDVILDADGIAWQRDGERIHYPWLAVGQAVQRDQDITDLVTKNGGRVLVCKARGIGVGGAP